MEMVIGKQYRFKNQEDILAYLGENWSSNEYWHQFKKVGWGKVWCELKDSDLHLIEEFEATK